MRFPEAAFRIIVENNCPFYEPGDEFVLSGKAVMVEHKHKKEKIFINTTIINMPFDKSSCRILIEDLTDVLIRFKSTDRLPDYELDCSGCTGTAHLQYKKDRKAGADSPVQQIEKNQAAIETLLSGFSIFRVLEEEHLRQLAPFLRIRTYNKDEIVIRKGAAGENLFVIISGKVEVVGKDGISIAYLERGEVFGEMSLLSGEPVSATIKVADLLKVICLDRKTFKKMLSSSSALQMYFSRLLAKRLTEVNLIRSEEFASGIVGKLSDIPMPELCQMMNANQKTGTLTLSLPRGLAKLSFKEGKVIYASYDNKEGKDAFVCALKEKEGRFKFIQGLPAEDMKQSELADFNWLLMDSLRRIDEEKA
ncbi:MAG: hypothetical protein BWK80_10425 [Desulfobacteraceae bacterium IS3]|nr:MAG: hypothetical protein BWK80_10425 [Desulfobacteraceae bacterium IS3]HAO21994.1 Crp/Fnr family transcriptional regulator [Desulfobacteraceae bacterium]